MAANSLKRALPHYSSKSDCGSDSDSEALSVTCVSENSSTVPTCAQSSSCSSEPLEDLKRDSCELAKSGRCFQLAWLTVRNSVQKELLEESMLMEEVRVSSACTGAYTAELALGVVEKTINDSAFLSRRVSFVPKSSHEIDPRCRQIIRDHSEWLADVTGNKFPAHCVFGNIEGILPPNTYHPAESFAQKLRDIGRSKLMAKQWCFVHQNWCPVFGPGAESQLDITGLPCWDYSLAGHRRAEQGQTSSVFMSHAKLHRERRTPLLILENVQALKMTVIELLYGDVYELYPIYLDVQDQGHAGASRPRVYIICAHRERVVPLCNVYDLYAKITRAIRKHIHTRPSDYLSAGHWEIMRDAELHASKSKKKKTFEPVEPGQPIDLSPLLTEREFGVVQSLSQTFRDEFGQDPSENQDLFIFLGDSVQRRCWSARSGRLPTFRRNCGKFWSVSSKRWLTPREKLSSLGFPVTEAQSLAMGVCILPVTENSRANTILGNSMNFASVGVIEMVALSSFKLVS